MPYDNQQPTIWVFSVLVDIFGRIEEIRGQAEESLGAPLRELAAKSILDLVAPDDRTSFLQRFGQLGSAELPLPISIRMVNQKGEPKTYMLKFEKGPSLRSTWLLFVDSMNSDIAGPSSEAERRFQEETQLLNLIEMAARQDSLSLDVTIIGLGALKDQATRDRLSLGKGIEFEKTVDRTVLGVAPLGLAGKASGGKYSIVHDRSLPPSSVEQEIREAAATFGVSADGLALKSVTVQIPRGSSVAELRARFRSAYDSLETHEVEGSSALRVSLAIAGIGAASIAIGFAIGAYLAN
jgi:hypothetical protein